MSHAAIASVLACDDLSGPERLAALSLASFADRSLRAWPSLPTAAARAGLSPRAYARAVAGLVTRGMAIVEDRASSRGGGDCVRLACAGTGPWWDGEINVDLLEAVLARSRARGPARALLAAAAAVASLDGMVADLSTEQLCAAAGLSDRGYRRARAALLTSGELELLEVGGGRGQVNRWRVTAAPAAGVPAGCGSPASCTARDRSGANPGRNGAPAMAPSAAQTPAQTPAEMEADTPAQTPAQTPAETPALNTRAAHEPFNPLTLNPPDPPLAESSGPAELTVERTYRTQCGRVRRRHVPVDLDGVASLLHAPSVAARVAWDRVRDELVKGMGASQFEIWLADLELRAVDRDGRLFVIGGEQTRPWVRSRYGPAITQAAIACSCRVVLADDAQALAIDRMRLPEPGVVSQTPRAVGGGSTALEAIDDQTKEVS